MSENGPFTYPDVSVSCDDRDRTAQQFIQFPCLMVEVLSPGTEAYDRGGKFAAYRRLESLQEYVLVGSETKTVEVSRRNPSGTWEFIPYAEGDEIHFTSVDRDSRSTLFMKTSSWRLLLINLPLPNVAVGDRTLGRALGSAQSGC
jgi:Putative restriction endonuclease